MIFKQFIDGGVTEENAKERVLIRVFLMNDEEKPDSLTSEVSIHKSISYEDAMVLNDKLCALVDACLDDMAVAMVACAMADSDTPFIIYYVADDDMLYADSPAKELMTNKDILKSIKMVGNAVADAFGLEAGWKND
jgi:hypothetical protein